MLKGIVNTSINDSARHLVIDIAENMADVRQQQPDSGNTKSIDKVGSGRNRDRLIASAVPRSFDPSVNVHLGFPRCI